MSSVIPAAKVAGAVDYFLPPEVGLAKLSSIYCILHCVSFLGLLIELTCLDHDGSGNSDYTYL